MQNHSRSNFPQHSAASDIRVCVRIAPIKHRNSKSAASEQCTNEGNRMPAKNQYYIGLSFTDRADDFRNVHSTERRTRQVFTRFRTPKHVPFVAFGQRYIPRKSVVKTDA